MDYVYRNTRPPPMAQPGAPRKQSAAGGRLSTIDEGGSSNPQRDNRESNGGITNLSLAQRLHLGAPPNFEQEKRPPSYKSGTEGSIRGPHGEHVRGTGAGSTGWKANMQKRGGWKRLIAIVVIILIICLSIGLSVGLGVGLSMRNSNDNNSGSTGGGSGSNPPPPANLPFPLGSWSFTVFLTLSASACASVADTWTCFPGALYSESSSGSQYTFNWIISNTSLTDYVVASSKDPFSAGFPNTTLTLVDANTPNEHYSFTARNLVQQVWPATPLTNDNSLATCFFNSTVLTGAMYTKKPSSMSASAASMMSTNSGIFQQWPYAANISLAANGGSEVPNCYKTVNNQPVGKQITLATEPASRQCSCVYENFM